MKGVIIGSELHAILNAVLSTDVEVADTADGYWGDPPESFFIEAKQREKESILPKKIEVWQRSGKRRMPRQK